MDASEAASVRKDIRERTEAAEERLLSGIRPRMIAVEGGEPMVWTDHEEESGDGRIHHGRP